MFFRDFNRNNLCGPSGSRGLLLLCGGYGELLVNSFSKGSSHTSWIDLSAAPWLSRNIYTAIMCLEAAITFSQNEFRPGQKHNIGMFVTCIQTESGGFFFRSSSTKTTSLFTWWQSSDCWAAATVSSALHTVTALHKCSLTTSSFSVDLNMLIRVVTHCRCVYACSTVQWSQQLNNCTFTNGLL